MFEPDFELWILLLEALRRAVRRELLLDRLHSLAVQNSLTFHRVMLSP